MASVRYAPTSCTGLTALDLARLDPSSLTDLFHAFLECSTLTMVTVDSTWVPPGIAAGSETFYNWSLIVGGNGTVHSSPAYGRARMIIDTAGTPGVSHWCLTGTTSEKSHEKRNRVWL